MLLLFLLSMLCFIFLPHPRGSLLGWIGCISVGKDTPRLSNLRYYTWIGVKHENGICTKIFSFFFPKILSIGERLVKRRGPWDLAPFSCAAMVFINYSIRMWTWTQKLNSRLISLFKKFFSRWVINKMREHQLFERKNKGFWISLFVLPLTKPICSCYYCW